MARYSYKARQTDGKMTQGTLRAASEERATALLRSHGLSPVSVDPAEETAWWHRDIIGVSVNIKDLILFSRQTASMIKAGVPVIQALQSLQRQTTKRALRGVIQDMIYDVEAGESLSNAMTRHPKVFSQFVLGIVRTGEVSGRLSGSLITIADYLEQDYVFLRKVRSAMIYPIFVLVVVVIMTIIMFTFVLP